MKRNIGIALIVGAVGYTIWAYRGLPPANFWKQRGFPLVAVPAALGAFLVWG